MKLYGEFFDKNLSSREIGQLAEDLACKYLEYCNYQILQRNYHCRFGEIDIVCLKDNSLVFVEVKARRKPFINPEESISKHKLACISKSILTYIDEYDFHDKIINIDVLAISSKEIKHIKNIDVE